MLVLTGMALDEAETSPECASWHTDAQSPLVSPGIRSGRVRDEG